VPLSRVFKNVDIKGLKGNCKPVQVPLLKQKANMFSLTVDIFVVFKLDFLRQIVNPITNEYWLQFEEVVRELRKLVSSDEPKYSYFENTNILADYLQGKFLEYWRDFRERYGNSVDQIFIRILERAASSYKEIEDHIRNIIECEIREVEYPIKVVDDEGNPLQEAKIKILCENMLAPIAEFSTNVNGEALLKLRPGKMMNLLKVIISHSGYRSLCLPLKDLEKNRIIMLERGIGEVAVKVLGSDWNGYRYIEEIPIESCEIEVIEKSVKFKKGVKIVKESSIVKCRTDKLGYAEFRLPVGEYYFRFWAEDFRFEEVPISVACDGEHIEKIVRLERERFNYLTILLRGEINGFYELIKDAKIEIIDSFNEFVPFQIAEMGERQIILKSESSIHFSVYDKYAVKITSSHISKPIEGRGSPPIIEVTLEIFPYNFDDLMKLSPEEFGKAMKELLKYVGYRNIKYRDRPGDEGVDIECYDENGDKVVVQCKRWKNPIGLEVIDRLVGTIVREKAKKGILITTSELTKQARMAVLEFNRRFEENGGGKKIEIYDSIELRRILRQLK